MSNGDIYFMIISLLSVVGVAAIVFYLSKIYKKLK